MKVKELIAKLEEFPDDMEVFWDDAVEGNDSEVDEVYKVMAPDYSKTPIEYGTIKAIMISPTEYESNNAKTEQGHDLRLGWGAD